jgi:hypothetical protein
VLLVEVRRPLAANPDLMTERSLCVCEVIHDPADAVLHVRSDVLGKVH